MVSNMGNATDGKNPYFNRFRGFRQAWSYTKRFLLYIIYIVTFIFYVVPLFIGTIMNAVGMVTDRVYRTHFWSGIAVWLLISYLIYTGFELLLAQIGMGLPWYIGMFFGMLIATPGVGEAIALLALPSLFIGGPLVERVDSTVSDDHPYETSSDSESNRSVSGNGTNNQADSGGSDPSRSNTVQNDSQGVVKQSGIDPRFWKPWQEQEHELIYASTRERVNTMDETETNELDGVDASKRDDIDTSDLDGVDATDGENESTQELDGVDANEWEEERKQQTQQEVSGEYIRETPDIDFTDVAGMDELKEKLRDGIIRPIEEPEKYEKYGISVENGVLLYGPPGTGKTYISKALAGEIGINYMQLKGSDVVSKYIGESTENVADIFNEARANQPCLIFIDEIDALTPDRGGRNQHDDQSRTINQFLEEISEINEKDHKITVIGATNRKDQIDDAMLRSGRLGNHIEVPLPDGSARYNILRKHLTAPTEGEFNKDEIVDLSESLSAADMERVAEEAARKAMRREDPVVPEDIRDAISDIQENR
jgi:AAA+ superfamily predicted ATPase